MAIQQLELQLNWTQFITPTVLHLAFSPINRERIDFIPGQFITFNFQVDTKIIRRRYSIASIPGQSKEIEMAVAPVTGGIATSILFFFINIVFLG